MPKETYIPCLLQLFRQHGYDGATLSKIARATGLGKASLYHHFPGGKDEMVATVLDYVEDWMEKNILQKLRGSGEPISRLQKMCDRLTEFYDGGRQPCILTILLLGSGRDLFCDRVQEIYRAWIDAIAEVLLEAGTERTTALELAEDAVIAIQGSLILSHGLNNFYPFQRILQKLPQQLIC